MLIKSVVFYEHLVIECACFLILTPETRRGRVPPLKHENIDMQQSTRGEARTGVAALEAWSPMTL